MRSSGAAAEGNIKSGKAMERGKFRAIRCRMWAIILCSLAAVVPGRGMAEKNLSAGEARRLIARVAGSELKTGAVRVKSITPAGAAVEVAAEIETAFRFTKDETGRWRAIGVRTGDRTWEELELLVDAAGAEVIDRARTLLEELVTQFEAQQRAGHDVPEIRRGAVRIKEFSPLLSSAVAVAEIDMVFRFARDERGKWRVAEITSGDEKRISVDSLLRAVNAAKSARARMELEKLASALEVFRRERGFYVVASQQTVLVDHLSPRYAPRVIRIDPWHRPYEYEGARDRFRLRSLGADGTAGTSDDIAVTNRN